MKLVYVLPALLLLMCKSGHNMYSNLTEFNITIFSVLFISYFVCIFYTYKNYNKKAKEYNKLVTLKINEYPHIQETLKELAAIVVILLSLYTNTEITDIFSIILISLLFISHCLFIQMNRLLDEYLGV